MLEFKDGEFVGLTEYQKISNEINQKYQKSSCLKINEKVLKCGRVRRGLSQGEDENWLIKNKEKGTIRCDYT